MLVFPSWIASFGPEDYAAAHAALSKCGDTQRRDLSSDTDNFGVLFPVASMPWAHLRSGASRELTARVPIETATDVNYIQHVCHELYARSIRCHDLSAAWEFSAKKLAPRT